MYDRVGATAKQVRFRLAQQLLRGTVDKGDPAVKVDRINTFAQGICQGAGEVKLATQLIRQFMLAQASYEQLLPDLPGVLKRRPRRLEGAFCLRRVAGSVAAG